MRVFDRDYKIGDVLHLRAYCRREKRYLDGPRNEVKVLVTHITPPGSYGLPDNIGVMSIEYKEAAIDRALVAMGARIGTRDLPYRAGVILGEMQANEIEARHYYANEGAVHPSLSI